MDAPRGSNQNLFPVLKNSTILQIMEEVNVPLSEHELTEPRQFKERVREVFIQLLNLCWGHTNPSQLTTLPHRILQKQSALDHPTLYDDAFPEAKFFSLLSKLLRVCGYYEFGFRDLAAPQAERFRRQLSAIVNFLKYREDMIHLEEQALEEREELFAALDEVTQNHMILKDHVEEAQKINQEKMLEREEAEAECKEMEAELAQQNKIQSSIRQETLLLILKKSANELKDEIANLSIALRELRAEERRYAKEVVQSPDRIKLDLARTVENLEATKKKLEEVQHERKLVQKRAEHAAEGEERMKDVMMAMEKMADRVQTYERVVEDCEDAKNGLEDVQHDLDETEREREVQEKRLYVAEQQKSDTVATLTSSLQTSQNELDAAVERLGIVESERLDGMARIEACEQRIEEIKSHMDKERAMAEEEMKRRIASFQKVEKMYWAKEEKLNIQLGY